MDRRAGRGAGGKQDVLSPGGGPPLHRPPGQTSGSGLNPDTPWLCNSSLEYSFLLTVGPSPAQSSPSASPPSPHPSLQVSPAGHHPQDAGPGSLTQPHPLTSRTPSSGATQHPRDAHVGRTSPPQTLSAPPLSWSIVLSAQISSSSFSIHTPGRHPSCGKPPYHGRGWPPEPPPWMVCVGFFFCSPCWTVGP